MSIWGGAYSAVVETKLAGFLLNSIFMSSRARKRGFKRVEWGLIQLCWQQTHW